MDVREQSDEVPGRTGNPRVDGVLDSLEGLADRPVDEHVAVFEQAHDGLRRALDAAGGADAIPAALRPQT